ncbi:MAG: hypothetical protein ACQ9ET_03565 [Nitrosomonadaceae bacterium]
MKVTRWVFCFPIGIATLFIAQLIIQIGVGGYFGAMPGSILDNFYTILAVGVGSAMSVYSAAYIAPLHKKWVSLVMAIIVVLPFLLFITQSIKDKDWIFIISGTIGSACAIYIVYIGFRGVIKFDREDMAGW